MSALTPDRVTDSAAAAAASPFALRITVAIIGAYIALGVALVPSVMLPGPQIPGFIALFAAIIFVTELSTAALLTIRFRDSGSWSLLLLACAYLFSGLMSITQILTFPGAMVAGRALLAVSDQTAAWIFIAWISGFAALTLGAVIVEAWFTTARIGLEKFTQAIIVAYTTTMVAALAVSLAAVFAVEHLPLLVGGSGFTRQGWLFRWPAIAASLMAVTIILVVLRERSHLFLWLSLALTALLFHNVLSGLSGARYTVGWTLGRISWLASACALFVYFFWQFARQQRLLNRAADLLEMEAQIADLDSAGSQPPSNMDTLLQRFVARENIVRYRNMLHQSSLEVDHREVISLLLAGEQAKLEKMERGGAGSQRQ